MNYKSIREELKRELVEAESELSILQKEEAAAKKMPQATYDIHTRIQPQVCNLKDKIRSLKKAYANLPELLAPALPEALIVDGKELVAQEDYFSIASWGSWYAFTQDGFISIPQHANNTPDMKNWCYICREHTYPEELALIYCCCLLHYETKGQEANKNYIEKLKHSYAEIWNALNVRLDEK